MQIRPKSEAEVELAWPMPYFRSYLRELMWSLRRRIRVSLGIKQKPRAPVLTQPLEQIVARHAWICDVLRAWLPPTERWRGRPACEVGAGDCLAAASMVLRLGASHITIIEGEPAVVGRKQADILAALESRGYLCDRSILTSEDKLNTHKCSYIQSHMEGFCGGGDCSLAYSICVCEHVEDLGAFFAACAKTLSDGGIMMHYIDLGGHGIFEDPMPPLEFHRFGDLLYGAIYPKYYRATRRFVSDYTNAAKSAGFVNVTAYPVRKVDESYIKLVRPFLKSRARNIIDEELAVIEFVLTGSLISNTV